jgi:hypothetical protein
MRIEILSDSFSVGQRAIIDKGNTKGRHIRLAGDDCFIFVEPGSYCTIVTRLLGSCAIVQLDMGKWRCEIDINQLTLV